MVMAVETGWTLFVKTAKFIDLGRHNILERPGETRMKHGTGKGMPRKIATEFVLAFDESDGTVRSRKRCCEVEVEAGVNFLLECYGRSAF